MSATPSREQFMEHLRANPPIRSANWAVYLARASKQGRRESRLPAYGQWLARHDRDTFEREYRKWVRSLDRAAKPPSTPAAMPAK